MKAPTAAIPAVTSRVCPGWKSAVLAAVGIVAGGSPAAFADDLVLHVPPGETRLAEIGCARVAWQSTGRDPVWMPPGWQGHFDDATGISCQAVGKLLGREALLLHSPWRVPPGRTWVEYPLALPNTTPIRLAFGIAMGPGQVGPDRSDGVTFSCAIRLAGVETELMRDHYTAAEWRDHTFDLSAHAGQVVTLRLQVEPGPENHSSFDFSYFGDARITVGDAVRDPAEIVRRLTREPAYQATAGANRVALSNSPRHGIVPSNLLPFTNAIEPHGAGWRFIYQGAEARVEYRYEPRTGTLDDFTVQIDDRPPFQPAAGGGASVAVLRDGKSAPALLRGGRLLTATRADGRLNVAWEYQMDDTPRRLDWTFRMLGKALVIAVTAAAPDICGFSLGTVGPVGLRTNLTVPYFDGEVCYLPEQNGFVCRMLDWTVSNASQCPRGVATYAPRTDGTRNPLAETGFIAVSPDLGEVLPNIPFAPSPFLATLAPRVVLDVWGHHQGGFAGDAAKLRELKDHGVDHLAIIQHDWQRYGYDVKLPDHVPANPRYGGDDGMRLYGKAANDCGYLWSLHENYIDLYPDAPSYDPAARVLRADGSPSPAWFNEGTRVQSFGLKCDRALGFARLNSPIAHRSYGTTAAYLDVHTCVPPWHQLDHDAAAPLAAMARAKVTRDSGLFQFERDTHGGPLFGEGANHYYWAGRCDGVEAQVQGGEDHAALLDFDLLKIHPQMVNHGMGYLERWFRRGYQARYGHDAGSIEQLDKYRAMEVAYGHAGFLGNRLVHTVQAVAREHHLLHPVQRLYGTAKPVAIEYEIAGEFVTASVAVVAGDTSRQRIRYDSGLTLWVNWRAAPWAIEGRVLPQWGFLARGPDTEVATFTRDGLIGDFAVCPEYVFADARTWFDLPYRQTPVQIEPRLRESRHLGGNRLQVTYEWRVNSRLDADFHCFVHGVNAAATGADHIVFQGDHPLPKPTSQWQPGEVIVDGPHELRVSDRFDTYDLTIGLHRDGRIALQGRDDGANRIVVARLQVTRQHGGITGITTAMPAPAEVPPGDPDAADFKAHTNPPGTWLDFGPVATDGAFKLNRGERSLVLFPYPRDREFRVSLDLKVLAATADTTRLQVRAVAAGDQRDLGPVQFSTAAGRLQFAAGRPGAGRYVVSW
jgi:hypothetical protein